MYDYNLVKINLGTSFPKPSRGSEITSIITANQGSEVKSLVTFPNGQPEEVSFNEHTAVYNSSYNGIYTTLFNEAKADGSQITEAEFFIKNAISMMFFVFP